MNRILIPVITAALAAAVVFLLERSRRADLVRVQAQHVAQVQRLELSLEEATNASQSRFTPEELQRMRDDHRELMQLRAEVARLREVNLQLSSEASEPSPPEPVVETFIEIPPPPVEVTTPNEEDAPTPAPWQDVGLLTPLAAFETLQYAIESGDQERLNQVFFNSSGESLADVELMMGDADNPDEITTVPMSSLTAIQVLEQQQRGPDEVELMVEHRDPNGEVFAVPMTFRRVGDDWKLAPTLVE